MQPKQSAIWPTRETKMGPTHRTHIAFSFQLITFFSKYLQLTAGVAGRKPIVVMATIGALLCMAWKRSLKYLADHSCQRRRKAGWLADP